MIVSWMGCDSSYDDSERAEMARLPTREALILHLLRAQFDLRSVQDGPPVAAPVTYTDPEDIPFGPQTSPPSSESTGGAKIPRQDQVIVLRWTWNKGRVCKTKKLAARKMKAWRRWYIRQGWKVQGSVSGDGLIAWNGEDRHAITLRVYAKRAEKLF